MMVSALISSILIPWLFKSTNAFLHAFAALFQSMLVFVYSASLSFFFYGFDSAMIQ